MKAAESPMVLTASELEFVACEERILINPRVRLAELKFTCEAIDELQPLREVEVPLLARALPQEARQVPDQAAGVARGRPAQGDAGRGARERGQVLGRPVHYLEMAKLLLANASSDLTDANAIRALLADIEDVRRAKVERGLKNARHRLGLRQAQRALGDGGEPRSAGSRVHALDSMRALDRQRRAAGADATTTARRRRPRAAAARRRRRACARGAAARAAR